jgi:tripartite-type tricarboxylate transporter receptor subunit TctC
MPSCQRRGRRSALEDDVAQARERGIARIASARDVRRLEGSMRALPTTRPACGVAAGPMTPTDHDLSVDDPPARRRALVAALIAGAAWPPCMVALAGDVYPSRPVKIIAPQAPGGGVDLVARVIAERLRLGLGQTFLIENVAGAGGSIATQTTARARPDGYTLMIGYVATHATTPAVKRRPGYDAIKDFTPVAMIGGTPNLLVVARRVPVATLKEFVDYAKANPGKVDYGTSGVGTLNHLVMEQFKHASGVPSMAVPYRSIGQAFVDAAGGQIQVVFPGLAAAMPHVRSGAFRPLAVTGARRHPLLPEVPTFKESGFDGFEGVTWYGIVGPAGLPDPIVRRLHEEVGKALSAPDLREAFTAQAIDVMPMTTAQFGQYIADEIAHWTAVARASKIEGD